MLTAVAVTIAGTADRSDSLSAGLRGFQMPYRASAETRTQYAKVVHIQWKPEFVTAGNLGGHTDSVKAPFVQQYVAPLIMAGMARSTPQPLFARAKVQNPDYDRWSGMSPGAWVRFEGEQVIDGTRQALRMRAQLVSKHEDRLLVERTYVVGTSGRDEATRTQQFLVQAMIDPGEHPLASRTAKIAEEPAETLTINGQRLSARVRTVQASGEFAEYGRDVWARLAQDDGVPGGLLKVWLKSNKNAGRTRCGGRWSPMQPSSEPLDAQATPPKRRRRFLRAVGRALLALIIFGMVAWSVPAILWSNLPPLLAPVAAVLFIIASAILLFVVRPRRRGLLSFGGLFALVLTWWLLIPASNTREWRPDIAVLASATIEGNKVTVHNIRNCNYRTETDYDVRHYDRTFDLDKLQTADLYLVYWGSPHIAHTMLSFGFGEDKYLCFSIETRNEKGEMYSVLKGFFKQYELIYVVADEQDLVRLRTNYRKGEDVYLYRLQTPREIIRQVFLDFVRQINRLNARPEWYNALTQNCTTTIRGHTRPYAVRRWPTWRTILNGHMDELGYENGALDHSLPFAELKARSLINARAKAADLDLAFSRRIREGLPGMEKHP